MKKLLLLLAAGSLWLFLAAIPALADGGPHSIAHNSGFGTGSTLTSDSCAGCHRAHTGKGSNLIAASSEEALCLSCHGDAGTGATTNVESGVQYAVAGSGSTARGGTVLGALRGGGFVTARIDSTNPYRVPYMRSATAVSFHEKVSVLSSGQPVTSAHVVLGGVTTVTTKMGTVWGNGTGTNAGATSFQTECTSCHNPHGNGQYRILLPQPGDGAGPFAEAPAVTVTDAAAPPAGDVRNYTIVQTQGGTNTLLASQVAALGLGPTAGDYFRRSVPWDPTLGVGPYTWQGSAPASAKDAPNGVASGTTAWTTQITAWCSSCHTQYATTVAGQSGYANGALSQQTANPSGSSIFMYRHGTSTACTVCHVAHGSNAVMTGDGATDYSGAFPYPDDTINADGSNSFTSVSASSRLLKIDNRGTCEACHDPTGTVTAKDTAPYNGSGTLPAEYVP